MGPRAGHLMHVLYHLGGHLASGELTCLTGLFSLGDNGRGIQQRWALRPTVSSGQRLLCMHKERETGQRNPLKQPLSANVTS